MLDEEKYPNVLVHFASGASRRVTFHINNLYIGYELYFEYTINNTCDCNRISKIAEISGDNLEIWMEY